MRDAHELHEGVSGMDLLGVGKAIQRVSEDDLAAGRKLPLRSGTNQRPDPMATVEKAGDQRASQVARTSGDKHAAWSYSHSLGPSSAHDLVR